MLNGTAGDKWIAVVRGDRVAVNRDFITKEGIPVTEHPSMVTYTDTSGTYTLTVTPGEPTYIDGVEYNINIT